MEELYIILAITFFVVLIVIKGIKQVPQGQAMIIERLGKYVRTLDSGINFIIPFLDHKRVVKHLNYKPDGLSAYCVDLREQVYDIPSQAVITRDNISLTVDTLIFYQIVEPHRALYEISDLIMAIRELSKTTMRNVFGEMDLDTSLSSRDTVNQQLRTILDEATDKWGVKILRVEIQDIVPPADLKEDMERQMRAERTRRQEVTIAEGKKQAAILEAEGIKQSLILNAQGESESRIMKAEAIKAEKILFAQGEAESIQLVQQAKAVGLDAVRKVYADKEGSENLLMMEVLRSQNEIAKDLANGTSQKIFLPNEAAGLFGSIKAIQELLAARQSVVQE
ncbi:MAG: SPFH/Band 7/PHB domain protein [Spirochaetales bacterium]|jgi:regulator of protease activity HflC (stomatin/prohibitin superfamily)|nr:SPFH/Band 7/PHB domain protein [Spirochaetales bacterium]